MFLVSHTLPLSDIPTYESSITSKINKQTTYIALTLDEPCPTQAETNCHVLHHCVSTGATGSGCPDYTFHVTAICDYKVSLTPAANAGGDEWVTANDFMPPSKPSLDFLLRNQVSFGTAGYATHFPCYKGQNLLNGAKCYKHISFCLIKLWQSYRFLARAPGQSLRCFHEDYTESLLSPTS